MFTKILVPIDLAHVRTLEKAISVAGNLAKNDSLPVVFAAVSPNTPSPLARTPEEFRTKLSRFASEQSERYGIQASGHAVFSHDPAIDLETALLTAVSETGADLVVMATHVPNMADHVWPSNGGRIASHSGVSVFLVR